MQYQSSKQLFNYWNTVRKGRLAPNRFEIEPSMISDALPDVFILECPDVMTYRFRLAGTRICTALGHELRGNNLLDYWTGKDKEAVHTLLHNVVNDGAGAVIGFECSNDDGQKTPFELLVLPLVHNGETVNRILGSICNSNQPYWLGTMELRQFKLISFNLIWPDMRPTLPTETETPAVLAETQAYESGDPRRRFRVLEGGLSRHAE